MKSSIFLIFLAAVGVAVADVSELPNRYLPPSVVQNEILQDFSATEAPTEVTTTSGGTTVVEIEQVPLEEMHYNEQSQQEQVQVTEQPSLPSVYEQPPALIYEAPIYEAQTEGPVASAEEVSIAEEVSAEKAQAQEAPISKDVVVVEEVPRVEDVSVGADAVLSDPSNINELGSTVDPALVPASEEAAVVKQSEAEVPLVEAEPEPAHVLSSDGYRYKTAKRFRYRF